MGNFLYLIALILVLVWAVGFFAFSTGSTIHVLLVIAAITVILRLVSRKKIL
jgi:hypothetical protein